MSSSNSVSVLIPVYNNATTIRELHDRLDRSLRLLTDEFEIIFVNDGSSDDSWAVICDLSTRNPEVVGIQLSRNFGQHPAIDAALRRVRGDIAVLMDADLQDQPEELPKLLAPFETNANLDIVYTEFVLAGSGKSRLTSRLFHALYTRVTNTRMPKNAGTYRAFRRRVTEALLDYPERSAIYGPLMVQMGFEHTYVTVARSAASGRKTSYTFGKRLALAVSALVSYSSLPPLARDAYRTRSVDTQRNLPHGDHHSVLRRDEGVRQRSTAADRNHGPDVRHAAAVHRHSDRVHHQNLPRGTRPAEVSHLSTGWNGLVGIGSRVSSVTPENRAPRCLVVGNTSVVGEAVIAELSQTWSVTTAGRHGADVMIDLADPLAAIDVTEQFEVAVVVAADFGGESPGDFVRAELVNAVGALSACRLADAAGVAHFVLMSSSSATYSSGDPYFGAYALSKRHGEEAVSLYCARRDIALTILRPTGVYDAAGKCRRHQPLLYGLVDRARAGLDITINGSADPLRNFIYISDLARIVKRVIAARLLGTFGCPGTQSMTISQIASAAHDAFGRGGTVRFDASRDDTPSLAGILDTDLYDQLSYWPEVDLADGLRRIAAATHESEAL